MIPALYITVNGTEELRRVWARFDALMADFTPVYRLVDVYMRRQIAHNFRHERDPVTSKPWVKTDERWLALRRGKGRKTLTNTGTLQRSITQAQAATITPGGLEIRTALKYARIHQTGGTINAKPGKFLAIPVTREAALAGFARRWIDRQGEGNWFFQKGGIWGRDLGGGSTLHYILRKSVKIKQRRYVGVGTKELDGIASVAKRAIGKILGDRGSQGPAPSQ